MVIRRVQSGTPELQLGTLFIVSTDLKKDKVALRWLFCHLLQRLKNERNYPIALLSFALSPVVASKAVMLDKTVERLQLY